MNGKIDVRHRVEGARWILVFDGWHLAGWANARGHWSDQQCRKRAEKDRVALALATFPRPALPVQVTLTRVAPRRLDDDGLVTAMKYIRDQVARWLYNLKPRPIRHRDGRVTMREPAAPDGRDVTDARRIVFAVDDRVGPPRVEIAFEPITASVAHAP